ncbi:MAG: helix-turn-helix domain-containing protein [Deltaproteobacteria bacterium]|nr:MAG: helix-turn-helix domain-containing protein [Deltaproteobacteria bacterium]
MKSKSYSLQVLPSDEDISLARASAEELSLLLAKIPKAYRARVQMDGQDLILPRQALALLRDLLAEMAQGNIVSIVPTHHLLTTQEAANILNVSRPFLIQILESGRVPFTKVGTHRRIRYKDLIVYKEERDLENAKLLDELTDEAQKNDMGY